jgi:hypothetical protein
MNFSIARFTALVLVSFYQALQEGSIGYQSDIRDAVQRLMSYLQSKYPKVELHSVLEQPNQEVTRTALLHQFERMGLNQDKELLRFVLTLTQQTRCSILGDTEIHLPGALPKRVDQPMNVLAAYGLDELLTTEDDQSLWATVVAETWGFPRNLQMDISEYYFKTSTLRPEIDPEWRLSEVAGRVFAKPWTEADAVAEMLPQRHEPGLEPAIYKICVSRPSANCNEAWISIDSVGRGGLIGGGYSEDWVRRPDGLWVPDKRGDGYIC